MIKWISVEDELPDVELYSALGFSGLYSREVMVCDKFGAIWFTAYHKEGFHSVGKWISRVMISAGDVTHWAEKPKTPHCEGYDR